MTLLRSKQDAITYPSTPLKRSLPDAAKDGSPLDYSILEQVTPNSSPNWLESLGMDGSEAVVFVQPSRVWEASVWSLGTTENMRAWR